MPTYTFEDKHNGQLYEVTMTMDEREIFLKENPHLEQIFTTMNIIDPITIGRQKPPSDFQKYVLGKVAKVPGADKSKLEKRWTIPREI